MKALFYFGLVVLQLNKKAAHFLTLFQKRRLLNKFQLNCMIHYEFPEKLFLEIKLPAAIVFNSFNSHLVEGSRDFVVIIIS